MASAKGPKPKLNRPLKNAGQEIVLRLGLGGTELARVAGVAKSNAYNWHAGESVPKYGGSRERLAEQWPELRPELWDMPPSGVKDTPQQAQARHLVALKTRGGPELIPASGFQASNSGEDNITDIARHARATRVMSSNDRHAATALLLRNLEAQIHEAIAELTQFERVTAHAGFRATRAKLLQVLSCDSELHALMLGVLPEPDPRGSVAKLRAIRQELEQIQQQKTAEARELLSMGAYSGANRIDGQTQRIRVLLSKAKLDNTKMKELLELPAWEAIAHGAAEVLRDNREALEVCAEELEKTAEPFAVALADIFRGTSAIVWPCTKYQKDILGFFRDILGIEPYDKQAEMLEMIQDNEWTAVASGHRVGKSLNLTGVALWLYCSWERARVFIVAPTERQLIEIDWYELKVRKGASGLCWACKEANKTKKPFERLTAPCAHSAKIDGKLSEKPKGGLKSADFRQVTGFTSKSDEGMAGLAGLMVAFIIEEASGVSQSLFGPIKGNLAGGGRLHMFGNPTRNEGEFYDAFYKKRKREDAEGDGFYATMRISSWDSPNVKAGAIVVPGLATLQWCEDRKREWGEESAQYKIRVLGLHAIGEDGRLFSVHLIETCEEKWSLGDEMARQGPLVIGVDCAGPSGTGDESTFAPRRDLHIFEVRAETGLDEDGHLDVVLQLIAQYAEPGETTIVNIDSEGLGGKILQRFQIYEATNPGVLKVHGLRASAGARNEPQVYYKFRDELSSNFAKWCRSGGEIPTDLKLSAEMHAHEIRMVITPQGERMQVTPKPVIIKLLKRSPDRYDACALAVWDQPVTWDEERPVLQQEYGGRGHGGALDPYADGGIDPYA